MEETYEHQLETIAAAIPPGGRLVGLVPTIDADQAAALAGDVAGTIGRARDGHTLLLTLDPTGSLDHEIGVEGGAGLTEILAGKVSLAQAAAHGRARGFIFVPAGGAPADGAAIAASPAFRQLCASAMARGGTVLIHAPREVLDAAGPELDGVIWLGSALDPAGVPDGWSALGALLPPGPPAEPATPRPSGPSGKPLPGAPVRRPPRRSGRPQAPRAVTAILVVVVLGAIALTAFVVARSRPPASFLPDNDSLWLAPPGGIDSAGVADSLDGNTTPTP
jgi:hypothetical protein